ncbi:MAG TPA: cardiolipin synthase [Propionibacteriaceae bacterium]|nr:cardiolipin synthase [Propionibacteriaceae bacterium]
MVTATEVSFLTVALYLFDLAIKVVALGLVPEGRRPSSATAWLLLILFLPVIGLVAFGLIGSPFVDRGRRRQQAAAGEVVSAALTTETDDLLPVPAGSTLNTLVVLNRRLGWLPAVGGNKAELFSDYDESIAVMAREVRTAERYVHVEFYIMSWDATTNDFFEALAEVAARGMKVRLLFDHIGTARIPGYRDMIKKLQQTAIEWYPMLPIQQLRGKWRRPDLRNHRKIVVVDGRVGFVGSLNMIDASYHNRRHQRAGRKWRELVMQLNGEVVFSLDIVFATDWYLETDEVLAEDVQPYPYDVESGDVLCQVVPSGPGFPDENNLRLFNSLIYSAQRRLSITSPYFVPDESLLYAITTAAQRGIDVELFVGEQGDQFMVHHAQNSYYTALLKAGVKIYLYPAPFVLHSKHFSVDDDVAVIGSSNMDIRSFNLDFEISVMCLSRSLTTAMRKVEDHYRSLSRELTLAEWGRRPLGKRYIDNVMRLTSALQ